MPSSAILFHGPGAKQAALNEAATKGRLVAPPFGGNNGLKTDEAREVVDLLRSTPVGTDKGFVVIGPMDEANLKSSDVLLKSLEEGDGDDVQALLWANDLGSVSPTIRSRCLQRWCPAPQTLEDDEMEGLAREMVSAALQAEYWRLPGCVTRIKGKGKDVLLLAAEGLQAHVEQGKAIDLWERVRKTLLRANPTDLEVLAAFLPETR